MTERGKNVAIIITVAVVGGLLCPALASLILFGLAGYWFLKSL